MRANMSEQNDWHEKVYKIIDSEFDLDQWIVIRKERLRKDKYRCYRCDKIFKNSELDAHHLLPRDQGGSNDMSNLVTLCKKCHDFVEINGLLNRIDIVASFDYEEKELADDNNEPDYIMPCDWRAWVYGGAKNPFINGNFNSKRLSKNA